MNIKTFILRLLETKKRITVQDVVQSYNETISRQYVSKILREVIAEGKAIKIGGTKKAFYVSPKHINDVELEDRLKRRLQNSDLKEHEVLTEININLDFIAKAKEHVRSLFDYAFSEMLNNAIEHSKSKFIEIEIYKEDNHLKFIVNDFGIGVFRNVMQERHLNSELEAIQDLLKGKTTTQPHAHSGEGIFFTSKVADVFTLESYDYRLIINNEIDDVFVEPLKPLKRGTRVIFSLAMDTKKHLSNIFKAYNTGEDDTGFDKTEIRVKLYNIGTIYVSRSQARRLIAGLDKFKKIILDYDKVPTIGQAFADEIYRVFQSKHLDINIESVNMNEAVKFMIERVETPKKPLF